MSNKGPGYVYILTNPSFREDWVKPKRTFSPQRRDNWQDVSENKKNIERQFYAQMRISEHSKETC